jgi:predicted Na+-dependent transporter
VALSVVMTALSTVVAVVLMPLLLYVYASGSPARRCASPTATSRSTLAVMLVPLALGMVVRARSAAAARRLEQAGGLAGIGVLLLLIGSGW